MSRHARRDVFSVQFTDYSLYRRTQTGKGYLIIDSQCLNTSLYRHFVFINNDQTLLDGSYVIISCIIM